MIGVLAQDCKKDVVREFFQLFKTPWEFYQTCGVYSVLLSTASEGPKLNARFTLVFGAEKKQFDIDNKIELGTVKQNLTLQWNGVDFPLYTKATSFKTESNSAISLESTSLEPIIIEIDGCYGKVVRLGYNLFDEVCFLLSSGQPAKYAHIPTLEIHISMLRELMLQHGLSLLEIPPVPAGHDFTCCLTHDVDFAGIRKHRFDPTMFGFLWRGVVGTFFKVVRRKAPWKKLWINLKAVLLLPAVLLGLKEDYWIQFHRYTEIEKGLRSSFFFIPFNDWPGKVKSGKAPKRRAVKYELQEIKTFVKQLIAAECEVGLHGLDAWHDAEKGSKELQQISSIRNEPDIGVRMHWLYFDENSPRKLEEAGFFYDATLGYNDAVGYWAGITQIFRPLGVQKILELPLNIQDTALFYPKRLGLSEAQAFDLCRLLIGNSIRFGGVLVINWHQRSLAPERLWEDFYLRLLDEIKSHRVWFATAGQVVRWFDARRQCRFETVQTAGNGVTVKVRGPTNFTGPGLMLKYYKPSLDYSFDRNGQQSSIPSEEISVELKGDMEIFL